MAKITQASLEAARRREQFVSVYAATGNAAGAAVAAGYAAGSAKGKGAEMMADQEIGPLAREARELYLADKAAAFERQSEALRTAADKAILSLVNAAATAKSEMARVQAAVAILDRAGHKPIERVESKNEHTFQPADANEVDSRLDRILGSRAAGTGASGDRGPTH